MGNFKTVRLLFCLAFVFLIASPPIFSVFAQEIDPNLDSDGDGLTDYDEENRYWSDPTERDTDGDTIDDGREVRTGTSPILVDSDGDFISDTTEYAIWNPLATNVEDRLRRCPYVADLSHLTLNIDNNRLVMQQTYTKANVSKTENIHSTVDQYSKMNSWGDNVERQFRGYGDFHVTLGIQSQDFGTSVFAAGGNAAVPWPYLEILATGGVAGHYQKTWYDNNDETILNTTDDTLNEIHESYTEQGWDLSAATIIVDVSIFNTYDRTVRIENVLFDFIVDGVPYTSQAMDIPEISLGQGENLTLHPNFAMSGDAWISALTTGNARLTINPTSIEQSVWNDAADDWVSNDIMQEYVQTRCALIEIDGVDREIHHWVTATVDKLEGINVLDALDLLYVDYDFKYGRMTDLLGIKSRPGQEVWGFAYFEQWFDETSYSDELNFEELRIWAGGSLTLKLSADADGDWVPNGAEEHFGTDPYDADSDDDFADDYVELVLTRSNPNLKDTDGGGTIDGIEFYEGLDLHDPTDDKLEMPDWYMNHQTIQNAKAAANALLDRGINPTSDELTWVAPQSPAVNTTHDFDGLVTYVKNMTFGQVDPDNVECLAIGDVDDDGDNDVVVGTSSLGLLILYENTTSGFVSSVIANFTRYYGAVSYVTDVDIGFPFDSADKPHIIVGTTYFTGTYLGDVFDFSQGFGDDWNNITINPSPIDGGVYSLEIGQVGDNDKTIIAVGSGYDSTLYNGNVTVYYDPGGGWTSETVALSNESRVVVTIGDYDTSATYEGNEIIYCTYSHNSTLQYIRWKSIGAGSGWTRVAIDSTSTSDVQYTSFMSVDMGDLDGDGDQELAVAVDRYAIDSDSIEFYAGVSNDPFVENIEFVGDEFVFDDFDNDGKDEVAYVFTNSTLFATVGSLLMIYELNGTGHETWTMVESVIEPYVSAMSTGDIDGDNDIEMLYGTEGNGWLVLWDRAQGALWADQTQIWTVNVTLPEPWIYEGEQFPVVVTVNNHGDFAIENLTMTCSHEPEVVDYSSPLNFVSEIEVGGNTEYTFLLWPQTVGNYTIELNLDSFNPRISHMSRHQCDVRPRTATQAAIGQALLDLAISTENETLLNASMYVGNWFDSVKVETGTFYGWNSDANRTDMLLPGHIIPTLEAASFLLNLFRATGDQKYLLLALGSGRYVNSLLFEPMADHLAFSMLNRGILEAAMAGEFFMDINQELLFAFFEPSVIGLANHLCAMASVETAGYSWGGSLGLTEAVVHFLATMDPTIDEPYEYVNIAIGGGNFLADYDTSGMDPWIQSESPWDYYDDSGIAGVSESLANLEDVLELDYASEIYDNGQDLIAMSYLVGQGRNWNEPIWTANTDALAQSVNFDYGASGAIIGLGEAYKNYGNQSTLDAIDETVLWITNSIPLIGDPSVAEGTCELALADVIQSMLYVHSITPVIFVGYFVDPMTSLSGQSFVLSGYVQTLGYYARGVNLTAPTQEWFVLDTPQTEQIEIGTIPEATVEVVTWDLTLLLHGTFNVTVEGESINAGDGDNIAEVVVTDVGVTKLGGPYAPSNGFVALQVGLQFNNETLYNIGESVFLPIEAEYSDTGEPAINASVEVGDHGLAVVDDTGTGYIVITEFEPGLAEIPISISYDKTSGISDGTSNLTILLTFTSLEVRDANVSAVSVEAGQLATFMGRICYSHNGMPVSGATVALDGALKATTDADGYYTFTHTEDLIGAQNHTITATSDGDNRITICTQDQTFEIDWVGYWNPVTMAVTIGGAVGVVVVVIIIARRMRKPSAA